MKNVVFLIDGFKLDGNDVHLKLFAGVARWIESEANVCLCVSNCRPVGVAQGKDRQELRALIEQECDRIYGKGAVDFSIDVLFDGEQQQVDARELFVQLHQRYGVIDMLLVASGYWRPKLLESLFIKLAKKSYFFKMGLHNPNDGLKGYDGLLSPLPELERLPPEFTGDVILRPTTYAYVGNIDAPLGDLSAEDREINRRIKQLGKSRVLVCATKRFTARLERHFYWLLDRMHEAYGGDIALVLAGDDADEGGHLVRKHCLTPITVESFSFQEDLPRFYHLLRKNSRCIYIHPDTSGGGHCKVLAALVMPAFIFRLTDSVQMHPVSLCSCKEEVLYKCMATFDDYGRSKEIVRQNKDYEGSFLEYSRWIVRYLLERSDDPS